MGLGELVSGARSLNRVFSTAGVVDRAEVVNWGGAARAVHGRPRRQSAGMHGPRSGGRGHSVKQPFYAALRLQRGGEQHAPC